MGALSGDMLEMRKCICQGEGGEGGERKLLGDMPGMRKCICQGQGEGRGGGLPPLDLTRGNGTRFMVMSLRSTFRLPSKRIELVMLSSIEAATPFMLSKGLAAHGGHGEETVGD